MLKYNFNRVFRAKAIDTPFSFLRHAGFSATFASKVKNNKVNRLSLDIMERLCIAMGCTPNDFLEWMPDRNYNPDKTHPIHELKRADKILDLTKTLYSLPLSKLEKFERMIKEDQSE